MKAATSRLLAFFQKLGQTAKDAIEDGKFDPNKFFNKWFRTDGKPYYFLFRKNLSVTNIQFAELIALVRHHLRWGTRPFPNVQIVSFTSIMETLHQANHGFMEALEYGATSRRTNPEEIQNVFRQLLSHYMEPLKRTIVAEVFHSSCSIFVPPHLSLDLPSVCIESGYIHSCGDNIFARTFPKTTISNFQEALALYLKAYPPEHGKKLLLQPYAHEDFTPNDRDLTADLRNGLDDVKLFVEKFHIAGDTSLVSLLAALRTEFSDKLEIAPPGDFRNYKRNPSTLDLTRTLWLLCDRPVKHSLQPERDRQLICYSQRFKNCNPYQIFDENKPAWIAHTTLPHSLAAAMINISKPWQSNRGSVNLYDPFAGSGTLLLESFRDPRIRATGADIEPLVPLLLRDNLDFFSKSHEELDSILTFLRERSKGYHPKPKNLVENNSSHDEWETVIGKYFDGLTQARDSATRLSLIEELKGEPANMRLLLYIAFRASVRHGPAHARKSIDWSQSISREIQALIQQTARLREQRAREVRTIERLAQHSETPLHWFFIDEYSAGTTVPISEIEAASQATSASPAVRVQNVSKCVKEQFDLIVTDPPYGINTDENPAALLRIYTKCFKSLLGRLAPGGQLIMCLPEFSHAGRRIPEFTKPTLIVHLLLTAADQVGLDAVTQPRIYPGPRRLFTAPYYWESERALTRRILHFRFLKK